MAKPRGMLLLAQVVYAASRILRIVDLNAGGG